MDYHSLIHMTWNAQDVMTAYVDEVTLVCRR